MRGVLAYFDAKTALFLGNSETHYVYQDAMCLISLRKCQRIGIRLDVLALYTKYTAAYG